MWNLSGKPGFCLTFLVILGAIIVGSNGKPPSRIKGGEDVPPGEGTAVVRVPGCTGGIIGPRHILTAAHCAKQDRVGELVYGGTVYRFGLDKIIRRIVKVYQHPLYNGTGSPNDIGIMEVDRDFNFISGRQNIVPLPTSALNLSTMAILYGWSSCYPDQITTLQQHWVRFRTNEHCQTEYNQTRHEGELCVITAPAEICDGDSGGPILSGGRLVGVATSSSPYLGRPTWAQNVFYYLPWINSILNQ